MKKMVMKKIISNGLSVLFLCSVLMSATQATDLPVFYKVPYFHGALRKDIRDWATELLVRYGGGNNESTKRKTSLFNAFGPVNIVNLGLGLDDIATKTTTNNYWGSNGSFSTAPAIPCDSPDGKVNFNADIRVRELSLGIKQNLFAGFFVELYAPLRQVQLNGISHTICGNPVIGGVNLETDFMQRDFPLILAENGFSGAYDRNFKQTKFTELMAIVGWEGYDDQSFNIIDAAAGSVQLGFIAPLGDKRDEDRVFAIPLGYNGAFGCNVRAKAEVAFWKVIALGLQAGANIMFPFHREIRMRTDARQNGWIALEKGAVKVDYGTIWDVAGYLKAENFARGLSVILGYSYTKQENTFLNVKEDCDFLQTVVNNALNHTGPFSTNTYAMYINKDDIVNTDRRYHGWDQHALHVYLSYDAANQSKWWLAPKVAFEYAYQLTGRRSFATNMLAGNLGLRSTWQF